MSLRIHFHQRKLLGAHNKQTRIETPKNNLSMI